MDLLNNLCYNHTGVESGKIMHEAFDEQMRKVIAAAHDEALRMGSGCIGGEHLFLGIINEKESVAVISLENAGIDLEKLREKIRLLAGKKAKSRPREMLFSPGARDAIVKAFEEARSLSSSHIRPEHLLLALVRGDRRISDLMLKLWEVGYTEIRDEIEIMAGRKKRRSHKDCFELWNGYYTYFQRVKGRIDCMYQFSEYDVAQFAGENPSREDFAGKYAAMTRSSDECERNQGALLLMQLNGEESWPHIRKLAEDNDPVTSANVASSLGSYPDKPQSLEFLLHRLKNGDQFAKQCAASSLGRLGKREAAPVLRQELEKCLKSKKLWKKEKDHNEIAAYAVSLIGALIRIGDDSVLPEALRFLKHPDDLVVNTALMIFIEWKGEISPDIIRPLLESAASHVRLNAAQILLKMGLSEGIGALRRELESPESHVRASAVSLLYYHGGAEGKKILETLFTRERDIETRMSILQTPLTVDTALVADTLREALAHKWPTIRLEAARRLGRIEREQAKALAIESLEDEPDDVVQKTLNAFIRSV